MVEYERAGLGPKLPIAVIWIPRICGGDPTAIVLARFPPDPHEEATFFQRTGMISWAKSTLAASSTYAKQVKDRSPSPLIVRYVEDTK